MFKKYILIIGIAVGVVQVAGEVRAQELGLTPSHVVGLWTNINSALVTVAEASSGGQALAESLASTTATRFENKKPADVLAHAFAFRAKLDGLLAKTGLAPTKQYDQGAGVVTPSVVFLNSGYLLDAVVGWIVEKTTKEQLVSPFYARLAISGKTPSDAFGMVDLAIRRIDRILSAAKG